MGTVVMCHTDVLTHHGLHAQECELEDNLPAKNIDVSEFDIVRTLGFGSFGRVKQVQRKRDGHVFALKCMEKRIIVNGRQATHITRERDILSQLSFPFIVNLTASGSDSKHCYLLLELVSGGELYTHIRRVRRFPLPVVQFYAAQLSLAIAHLHSCDVIHRDLKPENVLLTHTGYCKIADFGFAKVVPRGCKTHTICGTPEYLAPEMLLGKGHHRAVDLWTLGVLIYEMVCGQAPFAKGTPMGIYKQIVSGKMYFPTCFGVSGAANLVKGLLVPDMERRLGAQGHSGIKALLEHGWFSRAPLNGNMSGLLREEVRAPYKPHMKDEMDMSNYDQFDEEEEEGSDFPVEVSGAEDPFYDW
eukprot:GEMP01040903.1.p1 GENE.GEMP01040903.1~~GEMP01040903.1.p1  ORF type:complete len:358 (+),score=80.05 GEMP01040903.1:61-1134(+)